MPGSIPTLIRQANDAIMAKGRLETIPDFFAPGYIAHATRHTLRGHSGIRRFVTACRRSFPDLKVNVEILVTAKDRVAWQRTLRGTHRVAYKGFPAMGRRVVWRDMVISRFRHGLLAEDWVITDLAEQLLRTRRG